MLAHRLRRSISMTVALIVIVIIVIAAAGGAYYYFSTQSKSTSGVQTFSFSLPESNDPSHSIAVDALNHLSHYNLKADFSAIADPSAVTSACSNGQIDMFVFQLPTTTINAIETGANVVGIGEESTTFLQDLVVSSSVTSLQQLNGTTMAAYQLDGPVLFPLVWAANGQNFSNYQINLVVVGDSPVKAQGLIAGQYAGAFLDPADAASVFKNVPGKFHILTTTASAFAATGAGILFANKSWLKTHFQIAVDVEEAMIQSARNASANLQSWINGIYAKNFTALNFNVYNETQFLYNQADYFSPNMITFTPTLMNASDTFMYYGQMISSAGNVNQLYNFSVAQAALKALGTVQEPSGPFQSFTPLSLGSLQQTSSGGLLLHDELMALPYLVRLEGSA